ncbi:uncharacterized protein THITE_2054210 [Thermothielavioides terrestris NRRL 8126]|jgi:hypothetical protein|uniref:Trichothecene 3-O-acetyltransferase-like N-terminal domain-containing protein n=1 Tax=Thermothielavioides terrestris (strain ATCC 38088 / NRRL 8126) TaxID=578455 RepID=G2R8U5_THETT|nr:uncharacterized protein THITE_2054210 [Thermothielavioides terrestris NRRL 8126]AEO68594.1 hypothetical protein THITE_2054210 [Thermothielavioides terrestris NRRL 8126]
MDDYQNLDRYQDNALGQLPMLQVYSHLMYLFPLSEQISREKVVQELSDAVTKVRKAVPWLGARVVNVGKTATSSGVYRPVATAFPSPAIDVADATGNPAVPTYAEFRAAKAALGKIDSKICTPVPGFPVKCDVDSDEHPAHVVRVQATFVRGGVLVDFAIAHNMADARGHLGFIRLVAATMRGESIPAPVLAQACQDRRDAVPLLRDDEPMLDHSHHRRPPVTADAPLTGNIKEPARYHVFRFTVASMAALKELASAGSQPQQQTTTNGTSGVSLPPPPSVPFISTDDALCAFYWQRVTAARQASRDSAPLPASTVSRFTRQADGRRLVGLGPDYMADVIHTVSTWLTLGEVTGLPLSGVAAHLRARLDATNTAHHLRSFATFVAREPDKSTITYAGAFDARVDVGCTSTRSLWREAFPSFGPLLGTPEFLRRPPSIPFPGTLALFPGSPGGDCDAVACLTDSEFDALSADPEWVKYVEYIG